MTHKLQEVIERLRQMPEDRQEQLAQLMLHEIDQDEKWMRSTGAHADKLSALVADVLEADVRGECETLDPEGL